MRKKSQFAGGDRVLKIAIITVIILFVAGIIVVATRLMNPRVDASEGQQKLEEMAAVDVQTVDSQIQELEKAEQEADEAWQNRSANEKFANSLIIGDSISQGLYEYGVMDSSLVMAKRGMETFNADRTGLTDVLNQVIAAAPSNIFLALGMNDLVAASGDPEAFKTGYQATLQKLKDGLPDTKIYVNSILPAQQQRIDRDPVYGNIPQFNEKLKELCEEMDVTFIDNTDLVQDEYYAGDGIHMSPNYYPNWVNRMAEVAEL